MAAVICDSERVGNACSDAGQLIELLLGMAKLAETIDVVVMPGCELAAMFAAGAEKAQAIFTALVDSGAARVLRSQGSGS